MRIISFIRDSPEKFTGSNLINVDSLGYWTLKTDAPFDTDVFDGLQLNIDMPYETEVLLILQILDG